MDMRLCYEAGAVLFWLLFAYLFMDKFLFRGQLGEICFGKARRRMAKALRGAAGWFDPVKEERKKGRGQAKGKTLELIVNQPLEITETKGKYDVLVNVIGGGISGQAGAIRHGIARALLDVDAEYRPALKKAGFLTRDPREKERRKYGLKKARKASQFSKR